MAGIAAMADRYTRPDWVRRLNAMADAAGSAARLVPLDAGGLIDAARDTTGLDFADVGDGDWEGRFRAVVAAIDAADLTVVGRLMTREELLRCLRTRLFLGAERAASPAVADEQIVAPIVVTGPARSGTTILFELLALDDGLRSPIATDVMHPALPASISAATRRAMTESEQELWADVQPEFAAIHELRADLPVECITITAPSFAGSHWSMVLDDPGDWIPDPAADFAFHRTVLQSVQHGKPAKQWLLKTPAYLFMFDDLLKTYPDASVVFTHRDPARTMPSTVSTTAMVRWIRSDNLDVPALAELVNLMFSAGLTTVADRYNDGTLPKQTGHVLFTELMGDPTTAIAAAYDGIGRVFTDEHRSAILSYLKNKPRGKHGRHDYTAEEWGYDGDSLREGLASYISTFGIVSES